MNKCKAIVIDDEKPARELVKAMLRDDKNIELVGEAGNGFDALKLIHDLQPDLLFLDIQMPKISGIELLEILDNPPKVIFITAYDDFAIKAFELNAVDYLLKPFTEERLQNAIHRVIDNMSFLNRDKIVHIRERTVDQHPEMLERIVIKDGTQITVLATEDVFYIEAYDDYVNIFTAERKYLKNATMKYFQQHLDEMLFVRIHRSYIVNVTCVSRIEPWGNDTRILILKNDKRLKVSKTGYKALKDVLNI